MPKRHPLRHDNLRRALAEEAARVMSEHGIRDFLAAKRKAADRFGVTELAALPKNTEIEAALIERQRLFGGASHTESLDAQRRAALEAMRRLRPFEPRLVGPVLNGSATEHSAVQLHVFADDPESIALMLTDQGIRHDVTARRVKMSWDRVLEYPGVRFEIADQSIEATVFPTDGIRQAPVSPVDGRPMRRADVSELEAVLNGSTVPRNA